ncbi:MAG: hypothetical protein ACREBF_03040 [Candidatus Micrarchaeales archaeon]
MEAKKIKQVVLAIFVAVIFIASYASFGNSGSNLGTGSTTTTIAPQTVYASGTTNGTVIGYGSIMSILLSCAPPTLLNSTSNSVSSLLSKLLANNTINNFYLPNQSSFTIYVNQLNPYQLSTYVTSSLTNSSRACLTFKGQTDISIPSNITVTVQTQKAKLSIPANMRNYTILMKIAALNTKIPLRVAMLVTTNGTIFGNLSVSQIGGS